MYKYYLLSTKTHQSFRIWAKFEVSMLFGTSNPRSQRLNPGCGTVTQPSEDEDYEGVRTGVENVANSKDNKDGQKNNFFSNRRQFRYNLGFTLK